MSTPSRKPGTPTRHAALGRAARGSTVQSGHAALVLVALLWAGPVLSACSAGQPVTPRPDTVYVPHPDRVPADMSAEDLLELYAVSPDRDPDGLGVLPTLWLQSRMALVVPEAILDLERRNKLAYARTDEEQAAAVAARQAFFSEYVLFEGWLIGDIVDGVRPEWYLPEGIYLVDDRGRKFRPVNVDDAQRPLSYWYWLVRELFIARGADVASQSFPHTVYPRPEMIPQSFPRIVFPRAAITPQTRAVTLYFAALFRRMSFTWVFDPAYVPQHSRSDDPARSGAPGAWRR